MKILMGRLRSRAVARSCSVIWKRAVAVDADDQLAGAPQLDADGGRQAEAHGAEAAGGDELARPGGLPPLGGEHLVLADAGGDHRLAAGLLPEGLDHVLREQVLLPRLLVLERVLLPPGRPPASFHGPRSARPCAAKTRRTSSVSCGRSRFRSPTSGTVAVTSLEISAGSTSRWTILASGAKVESLPVTRSSKRAPRAMSRSAFCTV